MLDDAAENDIAIQLQSFLFDLYQDTVVMTVLLKCI